MTYISHSRSHKIISYGADHKKTLHFSAVQYPLNTFSLSSITKISTNNSNKVISRHNNNIKQTIFNDIYQILIQDNISLTFPLEIQTYFAKYNDSVLQSIIMHLPTRTNSNIKYLVPLLSALNHKVLCAYTEFLLTNEFKTSELLPLYKRFYLNPLHIPLKPALEFIKTIIVNGYNFYEIPILMKIIEQYNGNEEIIKTINNAMHQYQINAIKKYGQDINRDFLIMNIRQSDLPLYYHYDYGAFPIYTVFRKGLIDLLIHYYAYNKQTFKEFINTLSHYRTDLIHQAMDYYLAPYNNPIIFFIRILNPSINLFNLPYSKIDEYQDIDVQKFKFLYLLLNKLSEEGIVPKSLPKKIVWHYTVMQHDPSILDNPNFYNIYKETLNKTLMTLNLFYNDYKKYFTETNPDNLPSYLEQIYTLYKFIHTLKQEGILQKINKIISKNPIFMPIVFYTLLNSRYNAPDDAKLSIKIQHLHKVITDIVALFERA